MQEFSKKDPQSESQKLIAELMNKLTKETDKFMDKHKNKDQRIVSCALQSVAFNYMISITHSLATTLVSKDKQLDYINTITDDTFILLNDIKSKLRAVSLN